MKFFEKIKSLFSRGEVEDEEKELFWPEQKEEVDNTPQKAYDLFEYTDLVSCYTDDSDHIIIVKSIEYTEARKMMEQSGDWITLTKNIISEYLYNKYKFNFEDRYSINISKCSFTFKIKEIEFHSMDQIFIDYNLSDDLVIFYLEAKELYRVGNKNE